MSGRQYDDGLVCGGKCDIVDFLPTESLAGMMIWVTGGVLCLGAALGLIICGVNYANVKPKEDNLYPKVAPCYPLNVTCCETNNTGTSVKYSVNVTFSIIRVDDGHVGELLPPINFLGPGDIEIGNAKQFGPQLGTNYSCYYSVRFIQNPNSSCDAKAQFVDSGGVSCFEFSDEFTFVAEVNKNVMIAMGTLVLALPALLMVISCSMARSIHKKNVDDAYERELQRVAREKKKLEEAAPTPEEPVFPTSEVIVDPDSNSGASDSNSGAQDPNSEAPLEDVSQVSAGDVSSASIPTF